ncbi:hypothetical protein NKI95_02095 [Mesorhizobium sp. M0306]|uniref:hypothetical protein n=1 Tax=Mesorhizobium sp. M0306 TaxID=2956932 RepID=UPI0033383877
MSRLDHERPLFRLLASLKRERRINLPDDLAKLEKKFSADSARAKGGRKPTKSEERKIIHQIAVGIFDHVEKHKDITVIKTLLDHIDNKNDRGAVEAWFCKFGRVHLKAPGVLAYSRERQPNRNEAIANPFWTLMGERKRAEPPFDFSGELVQLLGKATERSLRPLLGDKVDLELLADIKLLLRER